MKVLFLDIDGVLNGQYTKEKYLHSGFGASFTGIDTRLRTMFLHWLDKHPEVKIVLSSMWRKYPESLAEICNNGIPLLDYTGNSASRGLEIHNWLKKNPEVTHYAILDDLHLGFDCIQQLHFVQTSYITGLRERNLKKIERILEL